MNRKEELLNAIKERKELVPLVDEVISCKVEKDAFYKNPSGK